MKITSIQVNVVHLPFKQPFKIAYETYKVMPALILKVETDEGIVGYGEAVPDHHVTGETLESTFSTIKHYLGPVVLGENPFNIERIHDKMDSVLQFAPTAKAAIDIACYDLMGKVAKQPIYNFLGGAFYKSLTITHVIGMGDIKQTINEAIIATEQGYSDLKIKVGNAPQDDVQLILEIRKAVGPKVRLRLDANQGWKHTSTALQALKELEQYDIDWVEQPIIAENRKGLAELRQKTSIPIMADEGIHGREHLRELITLNAVDMVNIKLMKCGGIYPALQLVHQAEMAGITCIIGSMIESSISTAAAAHLALSKKNIVANELGSPLIFSKDIAPMSYKKNQLFVPYQPGLGLQVNKELIKEMSITGSVINSSR